MQKDPLIEFVERDKVRKCIDDIVSKRKMLQAIRNARWENYTQENSEEEVRGLLREIDNQVIYVQDAMEQSDLDLRAGQKDFSAVRDGHWSLGAEEIREPLIPFLRGNLEPISRFVVAPGLPENVIALFVKIPGLKKFLKREIHGQWGYHYHYLDARKRRSDTLLTFERMLKTLPDGQQVKVITWERHGERSGFAARATEWGDKKRLSLYQTCVTDSAKRDLKDFKKPAKDAEVLWPV
ncbi:hypothetical protein ATL17_0175 [Maritalea mobilis]|jgi:hypothetical protein|uniref:Uncharacterized protein n=2 Tax=Maritalea mobilis TaxID=483324 RepID=A0A4V3DBD9_9HYPH|nr:hypothetical protein ATL17_0175 [Maritalea mobilis]